jgi:hypothetical protein
MSNGTGVDASASVEETMGRFAMYRIGRKGAALAAIVGLGALTVGCSSGALQNAAMQPQATSSVACEPNQRAVVRQLVVNGVPQSQIACESVVPGAVGTTGFTPVAYSPTGTPVSYGFTQAALPNTQLVRPVSQPDVVTRGAAPQRVAYQRAPERVVTKPKRSVGTSALIIGSSAAGGAGIGAMIGGKKGAGIGAIAGGGAAALWDQITRRQK